MKKNILSVMGFTFLSMMGCSSTQTTQVSHEKVMVVQPGDPALTCDQLEPKLLGLETEVQKMVENNQKRKNEAFMATTVHDLVLAFLSGGASANNHLDRSTLEGFTQPERQRINSLSERHQNLLGLSKQKDCGFVAKVEQSMAKYQTNNSEMMPDQQKSYRQRIAP